MKLTDNSDRIEELEATHANLIAQSEDVGFVFDKRIETFQDDYTASGLASEFEVCEIFYKTHQVIMIINDTPVLDLKDIPGVLDGINSSSEGEKPDLIVSTLYFPKKEKLGVIAKIKAYFRGEVTKSKPIRFEDE